MVDQKPRSQALESILREIEGIPKDTLMEIGILLMPKLTQNLIGKNGLNYFEIKLLKLIKIFNQ